MFKRQTPTEFMEQVSSLDFVFISDHNSKMFRYDIWRGYHKQNAQEINKEQLATMCCLGCIRLYYIVNKQI